MPALKVALAVAVVPPLAATLYVTPKPAGVTVVDAAPAVEVPPAFVAVAENL